MIAMGAIRVRVLCAAAILSLAPASPAMASRHGWSQASGVGRDLLIAAALGVPAVRGDWHGGLQAAESMGATGLVTYGLKEAIPERRPDGSDRKSFPSGHTSIAFAAAATLENRYGWAAGVPALLDAIFVGTARVEAHRHYVRDVVAGAIVGGGAGLLFTHRRNERVRLVPWAEAGGGGVLLVARF